MSPFLHLENKGPSVFASSTESRVPFQELPKSLAVILKCTVEIGNGKSFRLADVWNTAVQGRQVMLQIEIS